MYPASPAFLYMNPELLRYLLEPVIDYASSGQWPELYSPHDLGSTYPNATGHNDGGGENMPVEETANMLIMADAYMQHVSAAEAAANAHYAIFKQWADYLNTVPAGVTYTNAVDPQYQNQTDDFAGFVAHSVNLALKGIEGIDAFSQIAKMAGVNKDATTYRNAAEQGTSTWEELSQNTAGTHLLHTYREAANAYSPSTLAEADTDWSLLYNVLPNEKLGLNLIPSSILALWTGAALENATSQQNIIDEVFTYANATQSGNPFPDLYDPTGTTSFDEFEARPVKGGMFAPLVAVPAAK